MSDEALAILDQLTAIPWGFWLAVIAIAVVGGLLAAATSAPYSQLDDPSYLDDRGEYRRRA
jgi:hypothetical protein